MSMSSVRRIKERGGGGGKITAMASTTKATATATAPITQPTKTLTPVSVKATYCRGNGAHSLGRSSTGKENTRATSRPRAAAAKPTIRGMPRMEKSSTTAASGGNAVVRWSTSSVRRGRSASPSEFTRVLSDLKRNPRVSADRPVQEKRKYSRVLSEKSDVEKKNGEVGKRVSNGMEKNEIFCKNESKFVENEENLTRDSSDFLGKSLDVCSISRKLKGNVDFREKNRVFEEVSGELGSKGLKMVSKSGGLSGVLKEKGVSAERKSANKYPSKLHEKLAFLEGKVKRIASDIKKTKEILDKNNPDASKVILSDIQVKISGIEKTMANGTNGGDTKVELVKVNESNGGKVKESAMRQEKQVSDGKSSVKGLSVEELEARLLPHHKLLRVRTSFKMSSMSSQIDDLKPGDSTSELNAEKSMSQIEENPIALEFLASLNKKQSEVTKKDGNVTSEISEVQEMDDAATAAAENSSSSLIATMGDLDLLLTTNERLDEFDDQESKSGMIIEEETENNCAHLLNEIGRKTSTGGWFVSEGESVLLAHDDGSCTYYDITNCEGKAEYKPPVGVSPNMWRDCWVVRAPGADGCSGKYVVAASAGNAIDSGFCSWDFYTKDVQAFRIEDGTANIRTALADLPHNTMYRRNTISTNAPAGNHQQWWYKPCGPLIVSTASCQKSVRVYDIRDGEHIMKWELQKPVAAIDYSSPLQWRNRGKVVVAEAESLSLWDVSSLNPQALLSVSLSNRKISALHVNNTDAELGGGVRQRVSSSEVEGNDGVFCTADSINVLDFRQPSGVGLKIPKVGVNVQSVFSRGDSILLGCTSLKSVGKNQFFSQILQFSLRKQRLFSTCVLPESNSHSHSKAITQVWGNSSLVMGVCGLGLHVFDSLNEEGLQSFTMDYDNTLNVRDIIGPDDLYSPSFDYLTSRVLLISRDRPALWRFLS